MAQQEFKIVCDPPLQQIEFLNPEERNKHIKNMQADIEQQKKFFASMHEERIVLQLQSGIPKGFEVMLLTDGTEPWEYYVDARSNQIIERTEWQDVSYSHGDSGINEEGKCYYYSNAPCLSIWYWDLWYSIKGKKWIVKKLKEDFLVGVQCILMKTPMGWHGGLFATMNELIIWIPPRLYMECKSRVETFQQGVEYYYKCADPMDMNMYGNLKQYQTFILEYYGYYFADPFNQKQLCQEFITRIAVWNRRIKDGNWNVASALPIPIEQLIENN